MSARDNLAKLIVNDEKKEFDREAITKLAHDWGSSNVAYAHARFQKGGKASLPQMTRHAHEAVESAKGNGNVVWSDIASTPKASASMRPWAEAFVLAVEPDIDFPGSSFVITRFHSRYETGSVTRSTSDAHFDFTTHVPERMIERGDVSYEAIRKATRSMVNMAGFFAIGARLWGEHIPAGDYQTPVVFPLYEGLAIGRISHGSIDRSLTRESRLTPTGATNERVPCSPFACKPGVCDSLGRRMPLLFVGMTYLDAADLTGSARRVRKAMMSLLDRNPILRLLGMHVLFPSSRHLLDQVNDFRPEIASAYADLVRLHDDPGMRHHFHHNGPLAAVPPLPWDERVLRPVEGIVVRPFANKLDVAQSLSVAEAKGFRFG